MLFQRLFTQVTSGVTHNDDDDRMIVAKRRISNRSDELTFNHRVSTVPPPPPQRTLSTSPIPPFTSFHPEQQPNHTTPTPPTILACSSSSVSLSDDDDHFFRGRTLCQDRKIWHDHLSPDKFMKSTIRIVVLQSTQVISFYFTDQLKTETERDDKVKNGTMTQLQANIESYNWAKREWETRINSIPNRIYIALLKYHAVTLVMRLYESIASHYVTEVTLDKLTLDSCECAKRTVSHDNNSSTQQIATRTFSTCWHASIISYLADYSVHQIILLYGYYVYVQRQREKLQNHHHNHKNHRIGTAKDSINNTGVAIDMGSLFLSYFKKSVMLGLNRALCLTSASLGGSIGTLLWPGRGTMLGLSLGDAIAMNGSESFLLSDAPSS